LLKTQVMKVALIYMSRHGTTEKIIKHIAEQLTGEVQIFNLADETFPDIRNFGSIIIGGSIHYGSIQREIRQFCKRNMHELLERRVGLFVCCLLSTRDSDQFERAFPLVLKAHSKASAVFEGDLIYNKLNAIERLIFNPSKEEQDVIAINESAIKAFVSAFLNENAVASTPYIPLKS